MLPPPNVEHFYFLNGCDIDGWGRFPLSFIYAFCEIQRLTIASFTTNKSEYLPSDSFTSYMRHVFRIEMQNKSREIDRWLDISLIRFEFETTELNAFTVTPLNCPIKIYIQLLYSLNAKFGL